MKNSNVTSVTLTAFLLIMLNGLPAQVHSEVWERWVARYNSAGNGDDRVTSLAVDVNANVYVAGYSVQNGEASNAVAIKYNSGGIEQWTAVYDGPGQGADAAIDIAVDAAGNAYIAGSSTGIGTGLDMITIKYDAAGNEQWVAFYNGPADGDDEATSIALDADGNINVSGCSAGNGTGLDYVTIKYNSDGLSLWEARYNGPASGEDAANAVVTDAEANVYISGRSAGAGSGFDYATVKYDRDGIEQWVSLYNGPGNDYDEAHDIALDGNGNVVVTGTSTGSWVYKDYCTVKYDPQGTELWAARYDGQSNWIDEAKAVAVDTDDNIIVTGHSYAQFLSYDYATVKYNSAGDQLWVQRYNGSSDGDDRANAIALDADNNVYVTGYTSSYLSSLDYTTLKYNVSGTTQWVAAYNGPGDGEDTAVSIALDETGGVYLSGYSQGDGLDYDFATVKYSQNPPEVYVTLTPTGPVVLPASGGIIYYNIAGGNTGVFYEIVDVWVDVTIPLGAVYGPVVGPIENLLVQPGHTTDRDRELNIPGIVPPGVYILNAYTGSYAYFNPVIYAEDHLEFTKLESGEGAWFGGWFSDSGAPFSVDPLPINDTNVPLHHLLHPCFPNPFNARTILSFTLAAPGRAHLSVYDISGRSVSTLVNGYREAGVHEVTFDASELPSGIYLYRMKVDDFSVSRKMILIK